MICGILGAAFSFGSRVVILVGVAHVFLTGAFFMLAWIPEGYRKILLLFPMVHATEMMRDGLFGDFVETYYSIGYLLAANLVLTYIALVMVNVYKRHEGVYGKLF
jgi:capsular polysaccharide transport system permease protein